ncbi:MAG: hypothetical protein HC824_06875 [Synechococcales cyanobacterium RM1_1_8]|nr:hypothetical protein [Synechococcales cyanobacterium RM1_1_8]
MIQQPLPPSTMAPGNPIGYAPIYGPPAQAMDAPTTPLPTPGKGSAPSLALTVAVALASGTLFALTAWGWAFERYGGADINALQRQVEAANATAINAEQKAALAAASLQDWQAHSQAQGQTIDGVRALVCK